MAARPHSLVITGKDGVEHTYEMTKTQAVRRFHEAALQGQSTRVLSPAGNVLHGYRSEQGPVVLVDGALRLAQ